eukprot:CAMPEP_0181035036 /NCGR_PEP_ID=MMETSP1070-20121207/8115_1 /TAXON_ID=265543 /ORGANISM="Minutocellus polymorphus, Strain NH13" /LENGTH=76 /DNA_ID=CAMNT_0023112581 /DNA_START=336 /DNA_END=566 /DNA_ORIENTATION=-
MKLAILFTLFIAVLVTASASAEDIDLHAAAEAETPIGLDELELDGLEEFVEPSPEDRRLGYYKCKVNGPSYDKVDG